MKQKITATIIVVGIMCFSMACSKGDKSPVSDIAVSDGSANAPAVDLEKKEGGTVTGELHRPSGGEKIEKNFLVPFKHGAGRLLEYKINLTYKCEDISQSRIKLLELISDFGFFDRSVTSISGKYQSMVVDMKIKADLLYRALAGFDAVGRLVHEDITAVDHTENMALNELKVRREKLRLMRKGHAAESAAPGSKTWKDVQDLTEQSENNLDNSEHEMWKIRDSVSWASIHLALQGPEVSDTVEVPDYSNALVGMVNFFLNLVYGILYLLPVIALVIIILAYRKKIAWPFRRKKY